MINILALETTGKYGSAAVIKEDGSVYCASSETEMNHLKDIITISDEAVKAAGITKKELTHVAASASGSESQQQGLSDRCSAFPA